MTLRNQCMEDRRPFFSFFGDHMKTRTKLWHFPHLFWSSQNRRSVIFELTPCVPTFGSRRPCSRVTGSTKEQYTSICLPLKIFKTRGVLRGNAIGPWLAKLHRKVSKIEAWPPPLCKLGIRLWARNHLILGEKWDEI